MYKYTFLLAAMLYSFAAALAQSEFNEPWKDAARPIIIDPYYANSINWDKLGTDKRVKAIIHKSSQGLVKDPEYAKRKATALQKGYLWGAYHLGKPGDPIKQADFFLQAVNPDSKTLIALDIERTKDISLENARKFSLRIKEKTGRWPLLYANNQVVKEISEKYGNDSVFRNMPLWYARFKSVVTDFPKNVWRTYAIWQFSCEINCPQKDKSGCPYNVPGTQNDMDINVYNGTAEQLLKKWPL